MTDPKEELKPAEEMDQNEELKPAEENTNNGAAPQGQLSAEEELKQGMQEIKDKYLRLYSEFDNYKKRTGKERIELMQTAGREVILSLLPVLDDFERAIKAGQESNMPEGLMLIYQKLKNILESKGLKAIDSIGQPFDTDFHEAIANIPVPDEGMKGKVIDEAEKGYMLAGKVIRFAKVVVGE